MNLIRLRGLLRDVQLPNKMYFASGWLEGDGCWVRVCRDDDTCHVTKKAGYGWVGRRWIIEDNYDESHILRTLWACFMATMEHELREQFVYKGKLPFGPHFDINDVMAKADEVA